MNQSSKKPALRMGIGGPVGAGKTAMVKQLCMALRQRVNLAVITNDIYTREDADLCCVIRRYLPIESRGRNRRLSPYSDSRGCEHESACC